MQIVGLDTRLLSPARREALEETLAPSELRVLREQRNHHRAAWTAGRLALKLAAGAYACKPWSRVETGHEPGGAPRIVGYRGARCSLSHSGPLAVAAVAASPVGVDVERIRARHAALLDRIADPAEIEIVAGGTGTGGDRARLVTRTWTIKEAVLKRGGWGLTIPMRAVRILGRSGAASVEVGIRWQEVREECTVWTTLDRGFSLSIASNDPNPLGRVRWDPPLRLPAG